MAALSALILIAALAPVLIRPRNLHESLFAAVGALAMVVVGSEPRLLPGTCSGRT